MLATAIFALALVPRQMLAEQKPAINLETMIPKQFGVWIIDEMATPVAYAPSLQQSINKFYNQLLNRTYTDAGGAQIMLQIAYGGDQRQAMQVHQPETCYVAQGYQVQKTSKAILSVGGIDLPVVKLIVSQGRITESVIYWIIIGDQLVQGNLEQNFARWKYGLTGKVPYGFIIRVSSRLEDELEAYRSVETFMENLLDSLGVEQRRILSGTS
jgi:EpsI family protein